MVRFIRRNVGKAPRSFPIRAELCRGQFMQVWRCICQRFSPEQHAKPSRHQVVTKCRRQTVQRATVTQWRGNSGTRFGTRLSSKPAASSNHPRICRAAGQRLRCLCSLAFRLWASKAFNPSLPPRQTVLVVSLEAKPKGGLHKKKKKTPSCSG